MYANDRVWPESQAISPGVIDSFICSHHNLAHLQLTLTHLSSHADRIEGFANVSSRNNLPNLAVGSFKMRVRIRNSDGRALCLMLVRHGGL